MLIRNQRRQQGGGQNFRNAEFHARGEDHHARIYIDLKDSFDGAKRTITMRAPEVDPQGHVTLRERSLNVDIPKGIQEGQTIRLKGQGTPGLGRGTPGDLYLEVEFNPDPSTAFPARTFISTCRWHRGKRRWVPA